MDFPRVILIVECVLIALMVSLVLAHKTNVLGFKPAFGGFVLALFLSVLIILISLAFGIFQGRFMAFVPALVCASVPVLAIIAMVGPGLRAPKIHDISTRFEPPLEFDKAKSLRSPGENSLEPASATVINMQQTHYPGVKPLIIRSSLDRAYTKALSVAGAMSWEVVDEQAPNRFEAVAETKLFGFKDDIVLEFAELGEGEVSVNMRSVSRVGISDLGANARRIEDFLARMQNPN
jgi:uncharacterized protein (DUF1499 family)